MRKDLADLRFPVIVCADVALFLNFDEWNIVRGKFVALDGAR